MTWKISRQALKISLAKNLLCYFTYVELEDDDHERPDCTDDTGRRHRAGFTLHESDGTSTAIENFMYPG